MSDYVSRQAAVTFRLLMAATFLCFTTMTALSVLSVFLIDAGIDARTTGVILASGGIPIILSGLASGHVSARIGPGTTALAGMAIMIAGFASFEFTISSPLGAALSRMTQGAGLGLFMAPAMTYAKNLLAEERMTFMFGMYATMVPLPNVIGPLLAEDYYDRFGLHGLFLVLSIPAVLSLALMIACLRLDNGKRGKAEQPEGYLRLLRRRDLAAPNALILAVGAIWGFSLSFMAVFLRRRGVSVEFFFTTFTLTLIAGRYLLLRQVARLSRSAVMSFAVLLLGIGYLIIAFFGDTPARVAAGAVIFGLGHSVTYPTLSVWVTSRFAVSDRGRPVALFNTLFYVGIFGLPLFGGMVVEAWSARSLLIAMALFALAISALLAAATWRRAVAA